MPLSLFQELKQDISSFRYEVLGMMKGTKPSLQGGKSAAGASNLAYPDRPLKYSPAPAGEQSGKGKLNLFSVTTLLQQSSASSKPPGETFNGLANGSAALLPAPNAPPSRDKAGQQRKDFPKDISDFGLFQKRRKGNTTAGPNPNKIYSVSEEVGEVETELGRDGEGEELAGASINEEGWGAGQAGCREEEEENKEEVQKDSSPQEEIADDDTCTSVSGEK